MFQKQIFRQSALEKLSSPDELDELMQVTTVKSWLWLSALILIVISSVIWSVFGSVKNEIVCNGMITSGRGVQKVAAVWNGFVNEVYVKPGEHVEKGQMLASIIPQDLLISEKNLEARIALIKSRSGSKKNEKIFEETKSLQQLQNEIKILREFIKRKSVFTSPDAGIIIEESFSRGDYVTTGSVLFRMEPLQKDKKAEEDIEIIFFLKSGNINKAAENMQVMVSPVNVNIEESGYFTGLVDWVGNTPLNQQKLAGILRSEALSTELSGSEVFEARAKLNIKENTERISERIGSKVNIRKYFKNGTRCFVKVILKKQRPISLIFPSL